MTTVLAFAAKGDGRAKEAEACDCSRDSLARVRDGLGLLQEAGVDQGRRYPRKATRRKGKATPRV